MVKKSQSRAKRRPCVICGAASATTREHIPPKGFYIDRGAGQLATVPCCDSCNQSTSMDDERFIIALGFMMNGSRFGAFSGEPIYWCTHVRPILQRKPSLMREIRKKVRFPSPDVPIALIDAAWAENIFHRTMRKSVHGFHWIFHGEILPSVTPMIFSVCRSFPTLPDGAKTHFVGKQFLCQSLRAEDHQHDVLWFFRVFDLCISAETGKLASEEWLTGPESPDLRASPDRSAFESLAATLQAKL
jgi:hypothetical protein